MASVIHSLRMHILLWQPPAVFGEKELNFGAFPGFMRGFFLLEFAQAKEVPLECGVTMQATSCERAEQPQPSLVAPPDQIHAGKLRNDSIPLIPEVFPRVLGPQSALPGSIGS